MKIPQQGDGIDLRNGEPHQIEAPVFFENRFFEEPWWLVMLDDGSYVKTRFYSLNGDRAIWHEVE